MVWTDELAHAVVSQSSSGFGDLFGFFLFVFYLMFALGVSVWIRGDAVKRGSQHPTLWGLGVGALLFFAVIPGVVAIVVYFYARRNFTS
jgi:hypothetical protein